MQLKRGLLGLGVTKMIDAINTKLTWLLIATIILLKKPPLINTK